MRIQSRTTLDLDRMTCRIDQRLANRPGDLASTMRELDRALLACFTEGGDVVRLFSARKVPGNRSRRMDLRGEERRLAGREVRCRTEMVDDGESEPLDRLRALNEGFNDYLCRSQSSQWCSPRQSEG